MKKTSQLPFKNRTKYVLERKVDGVKTFLWSNEDDVFFKPGNDVDSRVASVINDKEFLMEGYVAGECFYVTDLLYYDDRDVTGCEWPERYKILKNNFRWNSAVKINRPLVVTDREEMSEAVELFNMLEYSEGVVIRDYNSVYSDEKLFLDSEVVS